MERRHFRIEYPQGDHPTIKLGKVACAVINISEKGVLFAAPRKHEFEIGSNVKATVCFKDQEQLNVEGEILRTRDNMIAVKLSSGVSFARIMTEQRYLLNRYGTLKQPHKPSS